MFVKKKYVAAVAATVSLALSSLSPVLAGSAWVEAGSDALPWTRYGHEVLVYGDQMWSLGGQTLTSGFSTTEYPKTLSSSDGATWADEGYIPSFPAVLYQHASVVFDGRMWVIGGFRFGIGRSNQVYSSYDGENWTLEGTLPVAVQAHEAVVRAGRIWVIGGTVGSAYSTGVYSSSDGVNWNVEPSLPVGLGYHSAVVIDNTQDILVIGGNITEVGGSRKVFKFNGSSWSEVGTDVLPYTTSYHASLIHDGKIWIIGGRGESSYLSTTNRVLTSTDGEHWTVEEDLVLPVPISAVEATVFNGTIYVIGGLNSFGYKKVWYLGA